jgi:ribose/xylose/arabinose/galactoside ABC-type transport system permease subunit
MSQRPSDFWGYSPLRFNEVALLGAIIVVLLGTLALDSNRSYYYAFDDTFTDIVRRASLLGIVALGAAVVIITGGIDLSVGAVMSASAVIAASVLTYFGDQDGKFSHLGAGPIVCAISASLLMGLMVGTLHTWLITSIGLPPFVATLASLVGLRSFARVFAMYIMHLKTNKVSEQINVVHPFFEFVRDHVSIVVVGSVLLGGFTWFLLSRSMLGRHAYALGGNEQAARLSGIRTENVKWFAYCFSSLAASVAGLFFMADVSEARPSNLGLGYELNAIAAAVVGGCALSGGVGRVPGVVLGALFLRVVIDAVGKLIKSGAEVWEGLIVGIVVVLAVTFTQARELFTSSRRFFPGARGKLAIPAIATFAALLAMSSTTHSETFRDQSFAIGAAVFFITLAVLVAVERLESYRQSR